MVFCDFWSFEERQHQDWVSLALVTVHGRRSYRPVLESTTSLWARLMREWLSVTFQPQMAAVTWEDSGLCTPLMGMSVFGLAQLRSKGLGGSDAHRKNSPSSCPRLTKVLCAVQVTGVGNVFCESLGVIFIGHFSESSNRAGFMFPDWVPRSHWG